MRKDDNFKLKLHQSSLVSILIITLIVSNVLAISTSSGSTPNGNNPCTEYQVSLLSDKESIPVKDGVIKLHDFQMQTKYLVPKKLKSSIGAVQLYCSGLADYSNLADVPVIFFVAWQ